MLERGSVGNDVKLCWNVIYGNFNSKIIETHNVFNHYGFLEDCRKAAKKYKNDRDGFLKEVRNSLMYYYWAKCEWEVIVSHWPQSDRMRDEKVDVYDQVMMNWDVFSDYIWTHRKEL